MAVVSAALEPAPVAGILDAAQLYAPVAGQVAQQVEGLVGAAGTAGDFEELGPEVHHLRLLAAEDEGFPGLGGGDAEEQRAFPASGCPAKSHDIRGRVVGVGLGTGEGRPEGRRLSRRGRDFLRRSLRLRRQVQQRLGDRQAPLPCLADELLD
jgi:hypothetical protein